MVGSRILVELYRIISGRGSVCRALGVDIVIAREALVGNVDKVRIRVIRRDKGKCPHTEVGIWRLRVILGKRHSVKAAGEQRSVF